MQTRQTDLARLLMGTKVFVVPQFQRHYKWKVPQWRELWADILEQFSSEDVLSGSLAKDEGHFLGSIVLHPAPGPASTVSRYWVIDGQQRLTTLLVLIAALRDLRAERDLSWDPNSYTNPYLANPYNSDDPYRLILGDNDRSAFVQTVYQGTPTGQVGQAYQWFSAALRAFLDTEDSAVVDQLEKALLLRMLLVEINTSDDDNINQIFNTINHSGMRLSAIDLIRNHSFMQFETADATQVYESTWKPLEDKMGEDRLSQYLWAQLVRDNPKATQRDLYGPFQSHLAGIAKRQGISAASATRGELVRFRDEAELYEFATERQRTLGSTLPDRLKDALLDLQDWGSQTYVPVALEALSRLRRGSISAEKAERGLRAVLSYLVRRGLAGVPSNNLNRILSALPNAIRHDLDLESAIERELLSSGKYWPRDREILERAVSTPIYVTLQPRQTKFILAELNDAELQSEAVDREHLTVEHVMPREINEQWARMLEENGVSAEAAESRTHVLGNLTLTGINSELGRRSPEEKARLLRESNLPLNRDFPMDLVWTPDDIDRRSQDLASRATRVWRRPIDETSFEVQQEAAPLDEPDEFDIDLLLDALPADSHARIADLAELMAAPDASVVELVGARGYLVALDSDENAIVGGIKGMDLQELLVTKRAEIRELVRRAQRIDEDED